MRKETEEQLEVVRKLLHLKQAEIAAITGLTLRQVNKRVATIRHRTGGVSHLQRAKLIQESVRQYLLTRPGDTRQSAVGVALGISTDQARRAMLAIRDEVMVELATATIKRPESHRMFWVVDNRLFSDNRRPQEVMLPR